MPLLQASLTAPLVKLATHIIASLGLTGVVVLNASTGVIGVPGTEPTMLLAGFNVFKGNLTLLGIIVFGLLGDVIGAMVAYTIGYYGRRELLERRGSRLHINPRSLARAEGWFDRRGAPTIVVSRWIPFARAAFPYAAGVARMPAGRFAVLVTLGSIPWIIGLGLLGREVGRNWQTWQRHLEYADYAVVLVIVLLVAWLVFRRVRSRSTAGQVLGEDPSLRREPEQEPRMDAIPK